MKKKVAITAKTIKLLSSLRNKKYRETNKLFIAEGLKLCGELYNSSYKTEIIVLKTNSSKRTIQISEKFEKKNIPVFKIDENIFNKFCDTVNPQEILAVVNYRNDEPVIDKPFIALDNISDPGNAGTIIRTAEWFGFPQVLLSENSIDKYNSKLIRATMGSIFRIKFIRYVNFGKSLKKIFPNHKLFGASLEANKTIEQIKPAGNFGLIFGSESHGLSDITKEILDDEFKIPGKAAESLNVSVAAGISMFYFKNFI